MSYRIEVDPDVCISSGRCVAEAPEAFRFDEAEIVEPVPGAPPLTDARMLELARNCPSGALRVFAGDEEIDVF